MNEEMKKELKNRWTWMIFISLALVFILFFYAETLERGTFEYVDVRLSILALLGLTLISCFNLSRQITIKKIDLLENRIKQLEDEWAECNEETEYIERVKNSDE